MERGYSIYIALRQTSLINHHNFFQHPEDISSHYHATGLGTRGEMFLVAFLVPTTSIFKIVGLSPFE